MLDWIELGAQHLADRVNGVLGPMARFLEGYVWNWPEQAPLLAILLLGTGLITTLRLAFVQVRGFKHAVDITRGVYDNPADEGDLRHFQALTTALSATVGIGNIAGVAIAVRMGGPGALFWMWVTAFFGMALKYAECTLALHYRKLHPDGSVSGGPMYYIEQGLGKNWRWMAMLFATCAMISSFGGGCMNQSNTLANQLEAQFGLPAVWSAVVFASLVGFVIIGGIRRIGRVTAVLAPAMAILYVGGALVVLAIHFQEIPHGFATIVRNAFAPEPLAGGAAGSFLMTAMWGIRRGLFSNEAGQGSAPIAHATAKTKYPVREGLVATLEPFIDTLVICSMTGLVVVMTGAYSDRVEQTLPLAGLQGRAPAGVARVEVRDGALAGLELIYLGAPVEAPRLVAPDGTPWTGTLRVGADGSVAAEAGASPSVVGRALLTGAPLTSHAFAKRLGRIGGWIVTLAVVLFAVSTGISWSYYGDRATEYVFGTGAVRTYRWVFVTFFFLGCILPLEAVWTFGDVALGLMSFPNLIALILLGGQVVRMTREYFALEHEPFRR